MEPYNVKVITFPDLSKQFRIYHRDVVHVSKKTDRYRNPFDDKWTYDIAGDIQARFDHSSAVSMKRTKSKVYNYAKCNDWDWFVTFTFSPEKVDRYDYDSCVKKLSKWIKNVKLRSSPALSYLVVPERHKDGAWHFHGLFSGLNDRLIVWSGKYVVKRVRVSGRSKFVRTGEKIYRFGSYKLGWMTATKVREKDRVTSYITKYITKELCDSSYGRKRYWASRNLVLPLEEVFYLDETDRFVLSSELDESSSYKKVSSVQYGDMTQVLGIYEIHD